MSRSWLAVALAAEAGIWLVAPHLPDSHFAGFRILAALGPGGIAAVLAATLALGLIGLRWPLPRGGWLPLALGAVGLHLAFWDLPQGQPDTVNLFVYAQHVDRAPLETLLGWRELVWGADQARFHRIFPLVPAAYGLLFRVLGESRLAVDLGLLLGHLAPPLATAWLGRELGREREGLAAGWLVLATPLLAAQSGWMLFDLPLIGLVTASWAAVLRARSRRTPGSVALAASLILLALATKVSAGLFLVPPLLVLALRSRKALLVGLGLLAVAGLLLVRPPFWRSDLGSYPLGLGAISLHLRPALLLLALPALALRDRLDALTAGALAALPVLLLYAPVEHLARYALPLLPLLALRAARHRALVGPLVASGLAMAVLGYRPLMADTQALNLQVATRLLQDQGVASIEVGGDLPNTTFPAEALTALVDLEATVPVWTRGSDRVEEPGAKQHWWEHYEAPPWHAPRAGAEGLIYGLYGGDTSLLTEREPGWREVETVGIHRTSSWLLPRDVVVYVGPR
jgi:hypothetical protein